MKDFNPIVSVCVQTYNQPNYIIQCLDGILMQQTNFDFEIILGEDESNDGTREICIEYANKYPDKIRLFLNSRKDVIYINGQATGRFNFIENLKASRGKYIALCEGDDYWTDSFKLQKQVDLLEKNDRYIACHHWQKIAIECNNGFIEKEAPKEGHGYCFKENTNVKNIFKNEVRLKTRTLMFRNIINEDFFPDWFTSVAFGDVPLTFLLGKHGDFVFLDEEMAVYRQTDTGVSKSGLNELGLRNFNVQHFKNWIEIWDYANLYYEYEFDKEARKTVFHFYERIIQDFPNSIKSYIQLLRYNCKERHLPFFKTFSHSVWISNLIVKLFFKKAKKKLKYLVN